MPIKRGGQDEDNNVFDWEKEELPDYLRDFAIDEDEVARHSRTVNPPIGATDMTTGPARIRPPREPEAPAPGDLPDWLNPGANRQPPQINMPGNDQPSLGNARSGASSGPLPGWLDANEPGRGPAVPPGMNDLDLGDLQPFNPEGADGFGGPSLQPPAMSGLGSMQPPAPPPSRSQPPAFQPPAAPSPFGMADDLGVGDIAPFSLEGLDGGGFGTSAPLPPPQPRQAPPAQPPASRPQPQAFQPPAMPSTPQYQPSASPFGGIGDELGDIAPFNPLDFGEAPTAPAPPVPPPTPRAQPQSFQPPAMPQFQPPAPSPSAPFGMPGGGFDDLGLDDLQPFSLEDAGGSPAPPPARPTPPPAAPQFPSQPPAFQPPAMPQFPAQSNEPAAFSLDDLGVGDIAPFNPFGDATPPPAPAPQSPAMPFNPPGFNAMPPIGGEGFVQAGPGSLFGNKEPAPPAGRPEQNMFSTDLPDDDIEPFSATGMDIPGLNGPTSFRGGSRLDDLPDEPIYRQPRPRNTQPEPEIEVEPGHEKPLQSFGWLKDRAARKRREEEEEEENAPGKGKSLFQKLAERRNQQLKQQPTEETPSPAEDLEVSGIDRFADYQSFEEIERQAELQEQGFAQPTPPTSPAKPTEPAFSFDFGSKQEEEPLAFEFRGDEPTPRPRPQETVQPFSFDFETPEGVPETPAPETVQPFSFDFGATEPRPQPAETVQPFSFDLGATEPATQPEAEEAVQPFDFGVGATEPEPMEPFNFDLGQPAPPAHPEPAFSFDFGGAKPEPEPEPAFDFNFEREQAPAAPQAFKLDEFHAQVEAEQAQQAPAMPDFDFGDLGMPSAPTQPGNEMFGTEEDLTDFNVEYAAPKAEQPKVEPPKPAPEPEQPSAEPFTFDLGELVAQPTPAPAEVRPRLQEQPVAKPEPAVPVVPKTPEPVVAGNGDLNSYLSRVKQNPKDLEANLYLANNFYEQSKFPEAITHYGNAIKSANADTLKEIVAKLEQITKSDEANPRFHRVLGDAYMKQGQYHWALSEYSKALPTGAKR